MLKLGGHRARDALEHIIGLGLQDVVFPLPPYSSEWILENHSGRIPLRMQYSPDMASVWLPEDTQNALLCLKDLARYACFEGKQNRRT